MKTADKDQVELQKIFMELPKTGITVVAFFATTSALILRLAPAPGEVVSDVFRYIFLGGILITLGMFTFSYNYIATIINNVSTPCSDEERAKQVQDLKAQKYMLVKNSITVSVVVWVLVLSIFVFFI